MVETWHNASPVLCICRGCSLLRFDITPLRDNWGCSNGYGYFQLAINPNRKGLFCWDPVQPSTDVDLVTLVGKSARVQAIDVGSRQMFEDMNRAIQLHTLHPVVDRVFGFSELGAALKYLGEARHLGKVCLRI
jgi:hypothetical protein